MNGVIRQVTLEGDLILHKLPNGRWAVEVIGVDLSKLLVDSCRAALNNPDDSVQWNIGQGQLVIVPGKMIEHLRNPPSPQVRRGLRRDRPNGRKGKDNGR